MPTDVLVVGPFPPPVNGAARVTRKVFEHLAEQFDVRSCDTGAATSSRSRYHLERVWSYVRAIARVIRVPGRRRVLYVGGSGGLGLWYQVVLVGVARAFGWRVAFHHHSYSYLRQNSAAMSTLTRMCRNQSLHIVLCPDMEKLLLERYPLVSRALVVSNACSSNQPTATSSDVRPASPAAGAPEQPQCRKGIRRRPGHVRALPERGSRRGASPRRTSEPAPWSRSSWRRA